MTGSSQSPPLLRLYTEDEHGTTIVLTPRPVRFYRERFITMFTSTSNRLAAMDRPSCYYRTLMHLLVVLDPIQMRAYSAREISEATGLSQSSAERSMAMLLADQVILSNGRASAARRIRLNNNLCWASTADRHNETMPDPEPEDARGR